MFTRVTVCSNYSTKGIPRILKLFGTYLKPTVAFWGGHALFRPTGRLNGPIRPVCEYFVQGSILCSQELPWVPSNLPRAVAHLLNIFGMYLKPTLVLRYGHAVPTATDRLNG